MFASQQLNDFRLPPRAPIPRRLGGGATPFRSVPTAVWGLARKEIVFSSPLCLLG
jgi:hypothetical protein